MDIDFIKELLVTAYGLSKENLLATPLGNGLINSTWKVTTGDKAFVFQRININVFKDPVAIDDNLRLLSTYLAATYPGYLFPTPVQTTTGSTLVKASEADYFRLLPFIENSHSVDVVETPEQAYKAALMFGGFAKRIAGLPTERLKITLPHFHDLSLRFKQFSEAVKYGNANRIKAAAVLVKAATENAGIVSTYEQLQQTKILKLRATHHDTKISNVLFDEKGNGLCVIDLDTLMPGYFISDAGDMLRTMLCPVSEEETDFSKIVIRDDYYEAIYTGYMDEMKTELSGEEQQQFFYSSMFMIYMQAIRFLTDYLNDDVYYGARYREHNFNRAKNQFTLLKHLQEKEKNYRIL